MWIELAGGGFVNLDNVTSLQIAKAAGGNGFVVRVDGFSALVLAGGPHETRELAQAELLGLVRPPVKPAGRSKSTGQGEPAA